MRFGVTDIDVIMGIKQAQTAECQRWNPETKQFESFPDYRVRLKATELIAKIRGLFKDDIIPPDNPPPTTDEARRRAIEKFEGIVGVKFDDSCADDSE